MSEKQEEQNIETECDHIQPSEGAEEEEEIYISHVLITVRGEVLYAYRSLELEENLPNGDVEIIVAIDALNHPEKGDRSIIIIPKQNIDYIQECYHDDIWDTLTKTAFHSQCEQMERCTRGTHGIYQ